MTDWREGSEADLLSNRTALVAGGTGSVGRVLVAAFLDAGARVVVPSRSDARITDLRASLPEQAGERLFTVVGDLSDEEDSRRVLAHIEERVGELDAAVATLGEFVAAPSVLEASLEDLKRTLDGYLLAHFMVARTLIPVLEATGGSYTFINGPLAFRPMFPGTGLVSIATAGQAMLARTVMKEQSDGPVRINELVIHTRFGPDDEGGQRGAVAQADVARYVTLLASDRAAGVRGETIHLDSRDPLLALSGQEQG